MVCSNYLPDCDCFAELLLCIAMLEAALGRMIPDAALKLETAALNGFIHEAIQLLSEDS